MLNALLAITVFNAILCFINCVFLLYNRHLQKELRYIAKDIRLVVVNNRRRGV